MSKCRYDVSEDCNNTDCLTCVLDKIRAEIKQLPITDTAIKLVEAVIDKYKAESEVEE